MEDGVVFNFCWLLATLQSFHLATSTSRHCLTLGVEGEVSGVFDIVVADFGPAMDPGYYYGSYYNNEELPFLCGDLVGAEPFDGCSEIAPITAPPGTAVAVIVDRGGCSFYKKVQNVNKQNAASLVVVANNVPGEGPSRMLDGACTESCDYTIPALMVGYEDGLALKNYLHAKAATGRGALLCYGRYANEECRLTAATAPPTRSKGSSTSFPTPSAEVTIQITLIKKFKHLRKLVQNAKADGFSVSEGSLVSDRIEYDDTADWSGLTVKSRTSVVVQGLNSEKKSVLDAVGSQRWSGGRHFIVEGEASLVLVDLELTGGLGVNNAGGSIYTMPGSRLTAVRCVFRGNQITLSGNGVNEVNQNGGGAITNAGGLLLVQSSFIENIVVEGQLDSDGVVQSKRDDIRFDKAYQNIASHWVKIAQPVTGVAFSREVGAKPSGCPPRSGTAFIAAEFDWRNAEATMCTKCPAGTYMDEMISFYDPIEPEGVLHDGCKKCPEGRRSSTLGEASLSGCEICAKGTVCRAGSVEAEPCSAGSFCAAPFVSAIATCTAGFYCPNSTVEQLPCRAGFRCPSGSSVPVRCDPGTQSNGASSSRCTLCEPGYTANQNRSGCEACNAGFVCVRGSISPEPCRPGTFNPVVGSSSPEACRGCPAGKIGIEHSLPGRVSEEDACIPIAEMDTTVILAGTGALALVAVPGSAFFVYKKGTVASALFTSLAVELGIGITSLLFDTCDVATDIVACNNVLRAPTLAAYHNYYLILTVIGTVAGLLGIVVRTKLILAAYRGVQGTHHGQVLDSSKCETVAAVHQREATKLWGQKKIERDIVNQCMNLGVFAVEDLPLVVLNATLLVSVLSEDTTEADTISISSATIVFFSLLFNAVMAGVKVGSIKVLKNLINERNEVGKDVELLKTVRGSLLVEVG